MMCAGVHTPQPSSTAQCGSRPALVATTTRRTRPSTPHATRQGRQTGDLVGAPPACSLCMSAACL